MNLEKPRDLGNARNEHVGFISTMEITQMRLELQLDANAYPEDEPMARQSQMSYSTPLMRYPRG
jgi:hypothetical protein